MKQATLDAETTAVRDAQAARDAAEVALLHTVIAWAAAHRVDESVVDDLTFGIDGVLLGGVGCPLVSEFDVYDLAAGLRMSSEAGCHYVAKILELRYRLPRTWERVTALEVPVWKAFRVAASTMNLGFEAAAHVDRMLAPVLPSCSFAQIERTLAQAIDLYDPDEAERRRLKAADDRSFDVHLGAGCASTDGTIAVSGVLALDDALDLDQAIRDGAKTLGDLGCEETLDVRRSMAVGQMARHQLFLDLDSDLHAGSGRGVTLYAHLDPDSLHATLDNPGAGHVLIDQIKAWCQTTGNTVTIKPVIDLNEELSTQAYTPTAQLIEQVRLRDQVCIFPNCTRRAQRCDLDHRTPYNTSHPTAGGHTATSNLSLLCRKHHRAKTFSAWTYNTPQPGVYDWTSPTGLTYRVTRARRHGRMPITTPPGPDAEPAAEP